MFRYSTLISAAAILALHNLTLTQSLSFQIASKVSTVKTFSARISASANRGVMRMKRGNHRTDTFLFYKNKEFEDDAAEKTETNTKQLQPEAEANSNSAVVDVAPIVSEAPPKKKSRVTRVVTSSIPAKKYVHTVVNLDEYNEKMKEEHHQLIVIRFFSHWCKVSLSCFLQDQEPGQFTIKKEVQSTINSLFYCNRADLLLALSPENQTKSNETKTIVMQSSCTQI